MFGRERELHRNLVVKDYAKLAPDMPQDQDKQSNIVQEVSKRPYKPHSAVNTNPVFGKRDELELKTKALSAEGKKEAKIIELSTSSESDSGQSCTSLNGYSQ
jgi:hypothetical protein